MTEARELLAGLHDAPRSWVSMHANDALLDLLIDSAASATDKRAAGAPMAYAIGRAAFRHLFLHVDERVLIPRPETEELVTLALRYVTPGCTVVDVGTGSGAIALALATRERGGPHHRHRSLRDAIKVAELNARAVLRRDHARTEFLPGNLLDPVEDARIDLIVSNPPYIALAEGACLPRAVRDWEPPLALFGGEDGMDVIGQLVTQAAARLGVGGMLLLEIDARRGREALALVAEPQWNDAQLLPDAFGRDRFLIVRRSAVGAGVGRPLPAAATPAGTQ